MQRFVTVCKRACDLCACTRSVGIARRCWLSMRLLVRIRNTGTHTYTAVRHADQCLSCLFCDCTIAITGA
jgi:hypothetical protein